MTDEEIMTAGREAALAARKEGGASLAAIILATAEMLDAADRPSSDSDVWPKSTQ